jgi:hypothetical protein
MTGAASGSASKTLAGQTLTHTSQAMQRPADTISIMTPPP